MKFNKMQGAGNDFLLFNGVKNKYENYSKMAKKLCDRRYGVGGDGIMIAEKSESADIKMVYYNSDGSKGEMCGNGIRCFSKFIYEEEIVQKKEIAIETGDGIKIAYLKVNNKNQVESITISMGKARLTPKEIPVLLEKESVINEKINIDGKDLVFSAVLIGVPHAIIISKELDTLDVNFLGERIEKNKLFPKNINVNFIQILDKNRIKIKTWERGAGRTLACGTGSCSGVYIANLLGLVEEEVFVETEGGILIIKIQGDEVFMTGAAETTFKGEVIWE
ncbi:diaminopimelate epimerase [Cetobacterium somerae]|uniref:diaminopimelate epimerase n=1 Tax=Cetobacterium sp. NK01 TaxID=2993530 RepID=UPI00211698BF|nr:diaminopimelate epimerase [Cetobacterium sp. NK01]MCQ8212495.1 diaminopimelate epimerase [Cetobacterium sp. NK01]